jgi:tagatose 6-phosphate kinase
MIICITLNPCLDKTVVVPPWRPSDIVRGTAMMEVTGGKGNNVARVLGRLGRDARPMTFLGGYLGDRCEQLLREQDGLDPLVVRTAAPTREILTVRTGDTAQQNAFIDPNPEITPAECQALRDLYADTMAGGQVTHVAMSGSSPCADLDDFWPEAIRIAREHNVPTILDTYGDTLERSLAAGPGAVKINRAEAEMWAGEPIPDDDALCAALDRLLETDAQWAIITLGADGAVAGHGAQRWRLRAPEIELSNPIGSGDAMAAAFIHAQLTGLPPQQTATLAVAAGTANARVWLAGAISPADLDELAPQVQVTPLA